ncbi:hypothetical protein PCE1_002049 [Barthelona sp. PCE]
MEPVRKEKKRRHYEHHPHRITNEFVLDYFKHEGYTQSLVLLSKRLNKYNPLFERLEEVLDLDFIKDTITILETDDIEKNMLVIEFLNTCEQTLKFFEEAPILLLNLKISHFMALHGADRFDEAVAYIRPTVRGITKDPSKYGFTKKKAVALSNSFGNLILTNERTDLFNELYKTDLSVKNALKYELINFFHRKAFGTEIKPSVKYLFALYLDIEKRKGE